MAGVTKINRDYGDAVCIVRIISENTLSEVSTSGYILQQNDNIKKANNGDFSWLSSDVVLVNASNGWGFFTISADFTSLNPISSGSGGGDFSGPSLSTDNAIVLFDGMTGKLGKNSLVTIDSSGNITTPGTIRPFNNLKKMVFVSSSGTDSIGNGSYFNPYKTAAYMYSQITDNSQSNPYFVFFIGNITETQNVLIKPYINIIGYGSNLSLWSIPPSVTFALDPSFDSINSSSVYFQGIAFSKLNRSVILDTSDYIHSVSKELIFSQCEFMAATLGTDTFEFFCDAFTEIVIRNSKVSEFQTVTFNGCTKAIVSSCNLVGRIWSRSAATSGTERDCNVYVENCSISYVNPLEIHVEALGSFRANIFKTGCTVQIPPIIPSNFPLEQIYSDLSSIGPDSNNYSEVISPNVPNYIPNSLYVSMSGSDIYGTGLQLSPYLTNLYSDSLNQGTLIITPGSYAEDDFAKNPINWIGQGIKSTTITINNLTFNNTNWNILNNPSLLMKDLQIIGNVSLDASSYIFGSSITFEGFQTIGTTSITKMQNLDIKSGSQFSTLFTTDITNLSIKNSGISGTYVHECKSFISSTVILNYDNVDFNGQQINFVIDTASAVDNLQIKLSNLKNTPGSINIVNIYGGNVTVYCDSDSYPSGGFLYSGVSQLKIINTTQNPSLEITTSSTFQMQPNMTYYSNGSTLQQLLLPPSISKGQYVRIIGKGTNLYRIIQNSGQVIHFLMKDTAVGVSGSATADGKYQTIQLDCVVDSTEFIPTSLTGTFTVV